MRWLRLALLVATLSAGQLVACRRREDPGAKVEALTRTIAAPSGATGGGPPSTRLLVARDAIHVENVGLLAARTADQRKAILAALDEKDRATAPRLAERVEIVSSGSIPEERLDKDAVAWALRDVLVGFRRVDDAVAAHDPAPAPSVPGEYRGPILTIRADGSIRARTLGIAIKTAVRAGYPRIALELADGALVDVLPVRAAYGVSPCASGACAAGVVTVHRDVVSFATQEHSCVPLLCAVSCAHHVGSLDDAIQKARLLSAGVAHGWALVFVDPDDTVADALGAFARVRVTLPKSLLYVGTSPSSDCPP